MSVFLPVNVWVVSLVSFIQTVDGFLFEDVDFLTGAVLNAVQSTLIDDILVKSVPDIQRPALQ